MKDEISGIIMDILEASLLDQIKMTEFWLDFDRKIFTPTNLNVGI